MASTQPDFVVIDTEGNPELREIAILDSQGKTVYHAFSKEHPENKSQRVGVRSLATILKDFQEIVQDKLVVFHYAEHDLKVLKYSCNKVGFLWKKLEVECSCALAKQQFFNFESYSLEYLSRQLNIKVENKIFNAELAHAATYDAAYTYQLYLKLKQQEIKKILQEAPNPFGNSRVDTPFQEHIDLTDIYHHEFAILKSILQDIKSNPNHQSKGIVVIGEPGSGKTHLMMRIAKELLQTNRLLFIRQPNNANAILFHIYSRILESLVETVAGTQYTQLEYLFASSFTQILKSREAKSEKDREILALLEDNPLNLYKDLGAEETAKRQSNWETIERRLREWWDKTYAQAGYSAQILKGIVKFCTYTQPWRRELVTRWLAASDLTFEEVEKVGLQRWNEQMSREAFALEAISVLSKLSLLDEPLIIVFDQLEGLGLSHNHQILRNFGEAVKEIFTYVSNSMIVLNLFPERWEQFQTFFDGSIVDRVSQYIVSLNRPKNQELEKILTLKLQTINLNLNFLFNFEELEDILNQNSIRAVLNRASDYYRYKVHGIPVPLRFTSQEQQTTESALHHRLLQLENELKTLKKVVDTLVEVVQIDVPVTPPPKADSTIQETIERYLLEKRTILEIEYSKSQIITDSDDIGKFATIAEAFQGIYSFEIGVLRLGRRKIPEHLVLKIGFQERIVGFLQCDSNSFTTKIKNFNELVASHKDKRFGLFRDARLSPITGEVGKREVEKLQNSTNGKFVFLDKLARIELESLYNLIVDIHNQDLDVTLNEALQTLCQQPQKHWLIKLFKG